MPYVERIAYNAKGQRVLVVHGNGTHDPLRLRPGMFRLGAPAQRALPATPPPQTNWSGQGPPLQDLTYTYDLGGNVTSIEERTPGCGVTGSPRDATA